VVPPRGRERVPPAHNGIGFLFARGKGVPQNYTKVSPA